VGILSGAISVPSSVLPVEWFLLSVSSVGASVFLVSSRLRARFLFFLRETPTVALALLIVVVFAWSWAPVRDHLEEEAITQSSVAALLRLTGEAAENGASEKEPVGEHAFQVTRLDVAYGSIQLFTANMQPVSAVPPSFRLRVARVMAPLMFVLWIIVAFSRAAKSYLTRMILRTVSGQIVVCGPHDRILQLVHESVGRSGAAVRNTRIVAVTDRPVEREVEKSLRRFPAQVISAVPQGSGGAFANAVSKASMVIIDFDDVATTFKFAEAALSVGRRVTASGQRHVKSRFLGVFRYQEAAKVHVILPYSIPPSFLQAVRADGRLLVHVRLSDIRQSLVEDAEVMRGSLGSPLRILVVTDDPDFVSTAAVFRQLFRQAERGLIDVLLIGQHDESFGEDGDDDKHWRRVRRASGRENIGFDLMSFVESSYFDDEKPRVPPSTPVFVCTEIYLGLIVIAELKRLWREESELAICFVDRSSGAVDLGEQMALSESYIKVINRDPLRLLDSAQVASPNRPVAKGIRGHLRLWGGQPHPSTLGERPRHPLLDDDAAGGIEEFVSGILDGLEEIGFGIAQSELPDRGVLGLSPRELVRLLAFVENLTDPGQGEASTRVALERRGAMLDLLMRVPGWLLQGGFILELTSKTSTTLRFSDDDLRRMAVEAHVTYLERMDRSPTSGDGGYDRKAHAAWDLLHEEYRESNLAQVRHLSVKLALLGLDIERSDGDHRAETSTTWPPQLVGDYMTHLEALSRLEHARWSIERVALGYRFGGERSAPASEGDLTHPNLVPYDELDEGDQQLDVAVVENIPRVLGVVGYRWVPIG
jgi:hypothetical protein